EGSELPPVFATGKDLVSLVDQARRWLAADGGHWPQADPVTAAHKPKGRPRGSVKRTKDDVLSAAEAAIEKGLSWRDFRQREQPQRTLNRPELDALRPRFGGRVIEPEKVETVV